MEGEWPNGSTAQPLLGRTPGRRNNTCDVTQSGRSGSVTGATRTQVSLDPLVSLDQLVQQSEVVRVCFVGHHPAARHQLQLPRPHQADQSQSGRQTQLNSNKYMINNDIITLKDMVKYFKLYKKHCYKRYRLTISLFCSSMSFHHLEK